MEREGKGRCFGTNVCPSYIGREESVSTHLLQVFLYLLLSTHYYYCYCCYYHCYCCCYYYYYYYYYYWRQGTGTTTTTWGCYVFFIFYFSVFLSCLWCFSLLFLFDYFFEASLDARRRRRRLLPFFLSLLALDILWFHLLIFVCRCKEAYGVDSFFFLLAHWYPNHVNYSAKFSSGQSGAVQSI